MIYFKMLWLIFGTFLSLLLFIIVAANPGNNLIKNKKTKEHLLDILTAFMGGFFFVLMVWLFYSGAKDEGAFKFRYDFFSAREWSLKRGANTGYFIFGFLFTYIITFIKKQYKKL
jgi:hypothetical protein